MQGTNGSSRFASSDFESLTSSSKYGGLIDIPPHKQLKNALFAIVTYLDTTAPPFWMLQKIVGIFRLFQLLGPSFCASFAAIIPDDSKYSTLAGIISIFYHLIPTFSRGSLYALIIYICVLLVIINEIFFISVALIYRKTAKLNYYAACLLNILTNTVGFLLFPIQLNLTGEYLACLIFKNSQHNFVVAAVAILMSVLVFVIHYIIIYHVFRVSISFRPLSLPSIDPLKTYHLFLVTNIISFITGLGCKMPKYYAIAAFVVAFILYVLTAVTGNWGAAYYNLWESRFIKGISISGAVNIVIVIVFTVLGIEGNLFIWIAYFASLVVSVLIANTIVTRTAIKNLVRLDDFEERGEEAISGMPKRTFLSMVVDGFIANHSLCLSFEIFNTGLNIYGDDSIIYMIYSKFVAIFPDASRILEMIQSKLINSGLRHSTEKLIVHQIMSITNKRQNVLSPSLKKKLTDAQKKEVAAKRKLLSIWDFVIQGNIGELDVAIDVSYRASNAAELELIRLRAEYPNNTFVARAYSRFMSEVRKNTSVVIAEQEKIRRLRRGSLATADIFNEFGMAAFPNLPPAFELAGAHDKGPGLLESVSGTELDLDEEGSQFESEQNDAMRRRIEQLTVPSIRCSILWYLGVSVVAILIPAIILIAVNPLYIDAIDDPTTMMYSISFVRELDFQIGTYITRIAVEELSEDPDNPDGPEMGAIGAYYKDYVPSALGGTRKTRDQLAHLLNNVPESMSELDQLREYKSGSAKVDLIRDYVFGNSVNISFTTSLEPLVQEKRTGSPIDVFMDATLRASEILATPRLTKQTVNTVNFLNPQVNVGYAAKALGNALEYFIEYVSDQSRLFQWVFIGVQTGISVFISGTFIFVTWYTISKSQKDTIEVFKCLTVLPKVVVSQAAESQRVVRKGSDSTGNTSGEHTEVNKQEENIIKVFMSAADSSSGKLVMYVIMIIAAVISCGLVLGSGNLICEMYKNQATTFLTVAPHIDYALGTATYIFACFLPLNCLVLSQTKYHCTTQKPEFYLEKVEFNFNVAQTYFDSMRFGGDDQTEVPYAGFQIGMDAASLLLMCDDFKSPPNSVADAYSCSDAEFQMNLFRGLMRKCLAPFKYGGKQIMAKDALFNDLWVLGPVVLFDTLLYPMFIEMFDVISANLNSKVNETTILVAVLLAIAIALVLIIMSQVLEINKRIKYSLSLLLHVQTQTVLSTPKIVAVLSGNFDNADGDQSTRSASFYSEIVDKLIDCIILVDEQQLITSMNKMAEKEFGVSAEQFIGKKIEEFMNQMKFEGDVFGVLEGSIKEAMFVFGTKHFVVTVTSIKGSTVYTFKDQTERVVHSKLIAEERAKSDKMLASILPAALVTRVQAGESNISFAVQSASVLFLDIVSFTPWCGSNQAAYVMKVLNRLFKDLDARLKEFPTLTKVKCIGDCYMAAGGIFSEVNQPGVHSREMVEFGLEAIKAVQQIDKELGEKLQIRVGVNTGGPLVAGVLGTAKPTFEILGPVINMAQQMEHHGVPMQVHISRATYELIYGSNFKIKERGEVEVKQGKVTTYLVTE